MQNLITKQYNFDLYLLIASTVGGCQPCYYSSCTRVQLQDNRYFNYVNVLLVLFGGECASIRLPVVAFSCKTIAPRLGKGKA